MPSIYYKNFKNNPTGQLNCGGSTSSSITLNFSYANATTDIGIYRNGGLVHLINISPTGNGSGSFTNSGLPPGSSFTYQMRHGNSNIEQLLAQTTCVTQAPPPPPPPAPGSPVTLTPTYTSGIYPIDASDTRGPVTIRTTGTTIMNVVVVLPEAGPGGLVIIHNIQTIDVVNRASLDVIPTITIPNGATITIQPRTGTFCLVIHVRADTVTRVF